MRRALATFLVAMFSLPLIAPVLLADTDSNLPACCRRGGQHHCAMSNIADQSFGTGMRAVQPRCPLFPKTGSAGISLENGLPGYPCAIRGADTLTFGKSEDERERSSDRAARRNAKARPPFQPRLKPAKLRFYSGLGKGQR